MSVNDLCLTFDESLIVPGVNIPRYMAYGVYVPPQLDCDANRHTGSCSFLWTEDERVEWANALIASQNQIERHMGYRICGGEICNEYVRYGCDVLLRHKPISYVGKKVMSEDKILLQVEWTDKWKPCDDCSVSLQFNTCVADAIGVVFIPISLLPPTVTKEHLYFEYNPDLQKYATFPLTQPFSIDEVYCGTDLCGYVATWYRYQLRHPKATVVDITEKDFVDCVNLTWSYIDVNQAVIVPENCKTSCNCQKVTCNICSPDIPDATITIGDKFQGQVCIKVGSWCTEPDYVYVTYGTGLWCEGVPTEFKEAVVKLALTKLRPEARICSCDEFQEVVRFWQESDPRLPTMFGKQLPFGASKGGMQAFDIISSIMHRPVFNQRATTGGLISQVDNVKKPRVSRHYMTGGRF